MNRVTGRRTSTRNFMRRTGLRAGQMADICGVNVASVAHWHKMGIPPKRLRQLKSYVKANKVTRAPINKELGVIETLRRKAVEFENKAKNLYETIKLMEQTNA